MHRKSSNDRLIFFKIELVSQLESGLQCVENPSTIAFRSVPTYCYLFSHLFLKIDPSSTLRFNVRPSFWLIYSFAPVKHLYASNRRWKICTRRTDDKAVNFCDSVKLRSSGRASSSTVARTTEPQVSPCQDNEQIWEEAAIHSRRSLLFLQHWLENVRISRWTCCTTGSSALSSRLTEWPRCFEFMQPSATGQNPVSTSRSRLSLFSISAT